MKMTRRSAAMARIAALGALSLLLVLGCEHSEADGGGDVVESGDVSRECPPELKRQLVVTEGRYAVWCPELGEFVEEPAQSAGPDGSLDGLDGFPFCLSPAGCEMRLVVDPEGSAILRILDKDGNTLPLCCSPPESGDAGFCVLGCAPPVGDAGVRLEGGEWGIGCP